MKPFTEPFSVLTNRLRGRGKKSAWIEYLITATCGIGNILFGYDQGVMGGFLTSQPFMDTFPSISNGNSTLQGFTVAVYEIGCAAGALSAMVFADLLGRRVTVMAGEFIVIIGAIIQATSSTLVQLIIGRIVTGLGNGLAVAILPTWNGECSRATNRGKAVLWQLNVNIFGIALAYWVDYAVNQSSSTVNTGWSWRFPLALQIVFPIATIILSFFLPDSPRALIKKGRMDQARDVLDMLSIVEDPTQREALVENTMSVIVHNLEEEAEAGSKWQDVFKQGKPRFFQRLVLAVVTLCMLQISGINLITYYAPVIFQNTLSMSRNTSLLVSGFNGLEYWIATFIPIFIIDRLGRRPIMFSCVAALSVCMAVLAGCIAYPGNTVLGYIATIFLFLFNTFFGIGLCGIPFLLPVELTPLQTRGISVAIATGFFWLCNFFVVMISPILINNIKYGTYILWCGTNFCFLPIIYFFVPETANATLEDVDALFESEQKWIIGPGSRKKINAIIASRLEAEEAVKDTNVDVKSHVHTVEKVPSR